MNKTQRPPVTRRRFLGQSAGAAAGMASWLALGRAPAHAQKRELTFFSWNHFVPAADDELRKQAEAFGKQANCTVWVDTVAILAGICRCATVSRPRPSRNPATTCSARRAPTRSSTSSSS